MVVAIIALLLPSLGKAKDNAKRTTCLANLKGLTTGAVAYAGEWDAQMPMQRGQGSKSYAPPSTYQMNNGANKYYGFALLYFTKAVTDPRVYYCPAQTDSAFMLNPSITSGQQWLDQNKGATGGRMGYMYQVHVLPGYSKGSSGNAEVAYPKYNNFPKNAIVGVDILWQPTAVAHGNYNSPGNVYFNASYSDGHAQSIKAPLAVPAIDSSWENSGNPNRGIVPCVNFIEEKAGV